MGAAGTAVSAISALVIGLADGGVAAGCGRETNRPNRCPIRPKREGGAGGVVVGGITAGGVIAASETDGSDTGTAVAIPGAASEGISCTGVGSGSSTCRCTDGTGAATAAVGIVSGKVGMGVTAVGSVAGCAGDSTGAEIVGPVGEDSGWR